MKSWMKGLGRVAVLASVAGMTWQARAQQGLPANPGSSGNLVAVLRLMDAASGKFKSAEADFKWDLYQRVVRETTTQTGTIYFLKNGNALQMGAASR